jgi:ankyrin repeat protein
MDALLDAIEDKLPHKVEEIIGSGTVNINHCDQDGYTPLILACTVGHHDIVEFLIENGSNVDFTAPDGASALFCAVQEGHWDVVELLIDNDANVNLQTNGGATPLYIASQEGFKSLVNKLLKHGAKPNIRAHGVSPLFIASQERHVSCVKELLKGGADPNQKNKSGGLPLIVTCFKGHVPVVKELINNTAIDINKCAAGISGLMTAAKTKNIAVINELIKHPNIEVNLKSKNQERNTAVHFAATVGSVKCIDALKAGGADISIENSAGLTCADILLSKHSIKYDGPKGSGHVSMAMENNVQNGSSSKDRSKKQKKKKSGKKSKRARKDEEAKRKLKESQETEEVAQKLFEKYDLNEDGLLDTPEFLNCLKDMGFKNRFPGDQFKHKVRECFKQFDKDGSGGICMKEFLVFHNWLKAEHGISQPLKSPNNAKLTKQKSSFESKSNNRSTKIVSDEHEIEHYTLSRDTKVEFGITFKVKAFGSCVHPLLKEGKEYLVIRTLRNLPDGTLGPASMQGLEGNDIILQLDKKDVSSFAQWAKLTKGKDQVSVKVLRLGDKMSHSNNNNNVSWGAKAMATTIFHQASPLKPNEIDTGFLPSIRR